LARSPEAPRVRIRWELREHQSARRLAEVWDRSNEGKFADLSRNVRSLSPEDEFTEELRLGVAHGKLRSAVWYNDLERILAVGGDIAWGRVMEQIAQADALSGAWLALRRLKEDGVSAVSAEAWAAWTRRVGAFRARQLEMLDSPRSWENG